MDQSCIKKQALSRRDFFRSGAAAGVGATVLSGTGPALAQAIQWNYEADVVVLGAGVGDLVLLTQGSSARMTPETKNMPIDAVVVGIVDQVHVDQQSVYSRDNRP